MCSGAVGNAPDVSTRRVKSPPLTVSAGEAASHHDMVTSVQKLIRLKAHYTGTSPVMREHCPHIVHHTLRTMPRSAIWHASTVLNPLDIRSQDLASSSEVPATERLVSVPKCDHIRLRHRSIILSRWPTCACSEVPLVEFVAPTSGGFSRKR